MADLYTDHFGVLFFYKRGIGVVCLNSGSYPLNTISFIYCDWTDCLQAVLADRKFGGMARFKHETTNAACKEWIAKNAPILWHVKHKLVMHVDC